MKNASIRSLASRAASVIACVVLLFSAGEETAWGDALPPPIEMKCKAGTTYVHNHSGSNCVPNAPTNCPDGWTGIQGGKCVLHVCETSGSCPPGLECQSANLCGSEGVGSWYGSLESVRSPLVAEPPRAQWMIRYADVCGPQMTCAGADKCVGSKVCLAPGVKKPASKPENAALAHIPTERGAHEAPPVVMPTVKASTIATTRASEQAAESIRTSGSTPPSVPPPGRGGAGCATSRDTNSDALSASAFAFAVCGVMLARGVRRRRRRA
jgi:hypothetical protein